MSKTILLCFPPISSFHGNLKTQEKSENSHSLPSFPYVFHNIFHEVIVPLNVSKSKVLCLLTLAVRFLLVSIYFLEHISICLLSNSPGFDNHISEASKRFKLLQVAYKIHALLNVIKACYNIIKLL